MKAILVEFIGTFFFLYVILSTGNYIAIGAALALAIYLGGTSGANFNPAVTIMMIAAKKQHMDTALPYIVAQVAGGLAALALYQRI